MQQTLLFVVLLASAFAQNSCQTQRINALMAGTSKISGVNLGSWLVLESWMSPAPWSTCNCSTTAYPGSYLLETCLKSLSCNQRQQAMNAHWSSFIVENDFVAMSSVGINLVRLPVGWWHIYDAQGGVNNVQLKNPVSPTDYQFGGLAYIDLAFKWGQKYGIGILLSMHAAPGSQGGTDNSSPPDTSGNHYWDQYANNQAATVDAISLYAQRYGAHPALWGISLLNEPRGSVSVLQQYYLNAYAAVRKYTTKAVVLNPLIVPAQLANETVWTSFMKSNIAYTNIYYDLHFYSCFGGPADSTNSTLAINYVNSTRVQQIASFYAAQPGKKLIIGEWSGANNFGDNNVVAFINAQMKAYSNAQGWTFWSWNGSGGGWKFQDCLNAGISRATLGPAC